MKRSLTMAIVIDAIILVLLIAITVWLNHRKVFGLAAMTNLGRFVVCLTLSGVALLVLIVLILAAVWKQK